MTQVLTEQDVFSYRFGFVAAVGESAGGRDNGTEMTCLPRLLTLNSDRSST